jgi:DNA-binding response OmpR family regulator
MIALKLNTLGFKTTVAATGAQALARLTQIRPRLLLLDIGLPDMTGFQVLEALRRDAAFKALPVLVLTARHAIEDVARAKALGANDYMAKPFELSVLINRIERLLAASKRPK